jgi:hypothetical protein
MIIFELYRLGNTCWYRSYADLNVRKRHETCRTNNTFANRLIWVLLNNIYAMEVISMQDRNTIERIAYTLWERDGRKSGRELDHWIEAERMVGDIH